MIRNKTSIALLILAATAAVIAWPRLSDTTLAATVSAAATETTKVAVARAVPRTSQIVAAGLIEPLGEELKIGSELDGRLRQVLVEEGSPVTRGGIIAILENGDYQARLALAKANLAEREAALERLLNGSRQEERREAKANVREVEAMLEIARNERDRRLQLLDRGAISRTEFDMADRDFRIAKARLEAANERYAFVDADARRDEVMRAEAEVARAKAQISEAEAMLSKTLIRSPINGVVLRRYLQSGESVSANGNTPIVSLGNTSELRVRVDVDETDVSRLAIGQPAYVRADAYGDRKFTGRVVQIGQSLGRKNVRTDEPTERVDTKILETLIALDAGQNLPIGLRVDSYIEAK